LDGVAIPNEVLRRFLPRECLGQLSGDPLGCGVVGDVDSNKVPASNSNYDETI
jgi:hypothetical protein